MACAALGVCRRRAFSHSTAPTQIQLYTSMCIDYITRNVQLLKLSCADWRVKRIVSTRHVASRNCLKNETVMRNKTIKNRNETTSMERFEWNVNGRVSERLRQRKSSSRKNKLKWQPLIAVRRFVQRKKHKHQETDAKMSAGIEATSKHLL